VVEFSQWTQGIGLTIGIITLATIIIKVLFKFIDLKWTVEKAGYVKQENVEAIVKDRVKIIEDTMQAKFNEAKATFRVDVREILDEYCRAAQTKCPRATDISKMSDSAATLASSVTFLLAEQKKLREDTLPEKYVARLTFKDTVDRIEKSVDKAMIKFDSVAENIYDRINRVNENWELKFMELMKKEQ
jgi:hypothetical protein